jgi:hypothetical protein
MAEHMAVNGGDRLPALVPYPHESIENS